MHLLVQFNIPDHCRACALSDPKDKDYQITCPHDRLGTCDHCGLLASVLADIHDTGVSLITIHRALYMTLCETKVFQGKWLFSELEPVG